MSKGYRNRDRKFGNKTNSGKGKKLAILGLTTVLAVGMGYTVYSHLPFVKVNKAIAAGDKYSKSEDFEAAIDSYSEAIEIDAGAVTAYCNMAGAYLSIDDSESAKKVLYDGWQNTENDGLLNNYHRVILNEAINAMNGGEGNSDTVLNILSVIEEDSTCSEAVEVLQASYSRCMDESFSFEAYKEILERIANVYESSPSEELKEVLVAFATPCVESFNISYEDALNYGQLLGRISALGVSDDQMESLLACFTDAEKVQAVFADIFTQLDVGNIDELRDFVVSEEYLELRDKFLNDEETPQEDTTYIAISRENMILNNNDGKWSYRFLNFEENPQTQGVITMWTNYFEDDGVQRCSISYEPGEINGNLYPHTKYSVTYLKSYINKGANTKAIQMNYRLATEVTTEDGEITETIVGDWGGNNEWVMDIETIESRIRA